MKPPWRVAERCKHYWSPWLAYSTPFLGIAKSSLPSNSNCARSSWDSSDDVFWKEKSVLTHRDDPMRWRVVFESSQARCYLYVVNFSIRVDHWDSRNLRTLFLVAHVCGSESDTYYPPGRCPWYATLILNTFPVAPAATDQKGKGITCREGKGECMRMERNLKEKKREENYT